MPSSNHLIGREIARLKRLYNTCLLETRPGKKRFAFYDYLYEVYKTYDQWRADLGADEIKRQIGTPLNSDQHLPKLIIDASCTADHKTKSRWGQALRYVWRRRKHRTTSRQQFDAFLNCNGGVAGCAAKIAKLRVKAIEGQLGFGFHLGAR